MTFAGRVAFVAGRTPPRAGGFEGEAFGATIVDESELEGILPFGAEAARRARGCRVWFDDRLRGSAEPAGPE